MHSIGDNCTRYTSLYSHSPTMVGGIRGGKQSNRYERGAEMVMQNLREFQQQDERDAFNRHRTNGG